MTRAGHADDPEARRLREAIAGDLLALRRLVSVRPGSTDGDLAGQVSDAVRANPAWAAGAAAGALAGILAAARRRFRRAGGE